MSLGNVLLCSADATHREIRAAIHQLAKATNAAHAIKG